MPITSNPYAEKVFAEHPIALWALDEKVDYISLIVEYQRNMEETWSFYDSTDSYLSPSEISNSFGYDVTLPNDFPKRVFDSYVNQIFVPASGNVVKSYSTSVLSSGTIETFKSLSLGSYIYTFGKSANVSVGFEYKDSSEQTVRKTNTANLLPLEEWQFVSASFKMPDVFSDLKLIVEVEFSSAFEEGESILVHGISLGQWAEQFHVESLGTETFALPDDIAISGYGAGASSYGLQDISGYYLENDHATLCATNSGIPMVYGATSSTIITPNDNGKPSLIVPGYGFMNDYGQYSELTFEMWIKIQSSATTPKRIFGPIASSDGLYVNDSFLVLKVGQYNASYYVGEWDRPMLVAIRMLPSSASVIVNGEEVISLAIDPNRVSFPKKVNEFGESQDWLGFYSYEDVPSISLDCLGIYPYDVPAIVEKRRWVYGQGVDPSSASGASGLGNIISFDYTFSKYARNYSYPDIGSWNGGIKENIVAEKLALSLPQYSLPDFVFSNKTLEDFHSDVSALDFSLYGEYFSLKPNENWNETESYVYFKNLNVLQQDVKAFYMLAESDESNSEKQILFILEKEVTGEAIEVSLTGSTVTYDFKYLTSTGVVSETFNEDETHIAGEFLFVGFDIDKVSRSFGGRISSFLGSKQQLKLYVGGSKDFENTFSGKIYRIGFSTARNLEKISNVFDSRGLPAGFNSFDTENAGDAGSTIFENDDDNNGILYWDRYWDAGDEYFGNNSSVFSDIIDAGTVYGLLVSNILLHVASYTLIPKTYLGNYVIDIGVNSYWQDAVPLSYFGKFVDNGISTQDSAAGKVKELDFFQVNIDYPKIHKFLANSFDTTESLVRTFVSFQEIRDNASVSVKRFQKTVLAPKTGAIYAGDDWQTRNPDGTIDYLKYEVVDNMVVYPPDNIDFNKIAAVFHIEIISRGISENPVKVRSLQVASQALNIQDKTPVGTRYGVDVVPYRRSSGFVDYKFRNPYSIYKGSTPYFYLTATSGMQLVGFRGGEMERGVEVLLNEHSSQFFKVAAIQMAMKFDDDTFPSTVTEIFEIYANGSDGTRTIKLYLVPDDDLLYRGKIYAIDADTGLQDSDVLFYINGRRVANPVINPRMWSILGIGFAEPVDMSENVGALRVTGPILFNNLSYYQSSQADENARSVYRKWSQIKTEEQLDKNWAYWKDRDSDPNTAGTQIYAWRNVLIVSSEGYAGFDVASVYRKYTGSDRIVFDTSSRFKFRNYRYRVLKDIQWQSNVIDPV